MFKRNHYQALENDLIASYGRGWEAFMLIHHGQLFQPVVIVVFVFVEEFTST